MSKIKEVEDWLKKKWDGVMDFITHKSIPVALVIVNSLKEAVQSGAGDFTVGLTKTKIDDAILAKIREYIPKAMIELSAAEALLEAMGTNEEIITSLIQWLKDQSITFQTNFYIGFAGKLNEFLADGKLSVGEAVSLAQLAYSEYSKK